MTYTPQTAYRPDIQALRAIAVLAVIVCHMNPKWLPGGYLGVDIFFVISGFVITNLIIKQGPDFNFIKFWAARFFRIFPAYAFMLTFVALGAAILFLPENFSQFSKSWVKSIYFLSNDYFAGYGDYFSPKLTEQPLLHTWSLSVEMQFYLIYPIILLLCAWLRKLWILWVVVVIGFILAQLYWVQVGNAAPLYYSLLIRVPEFLLGGAIAASPRIIDISEDLQVFLACLGVVAVATSFFLITEKNFSPMMAAIPCVGVGLVILGRLHHGALVNIFNFPAIIFLGAISYSLYLWHWPILAFTRYVLGEIQWSIFLVTVYLVGVLLISYLSWRFVETRLHNKTVKKGWPLLKRAGLLLAMVLSPIAFAKTINQIPPKLPVELSRYADNEKICHGKILESCLRGANNLTPPLKRILLIGDSHAAMLNLTADSISAKTGLAFEVITGSSCLPIEGFDYHGLPAWAQKPCVQQIQYVKNKIVEFDLVVVAAKWSTHSKNPQSMHSLRSFIKEGSDVGRKILILGQVPEMQVDPRRAERLLHWGIRVPVFESNGFIIANNLIDQFVDDFVGIRFFDPNNLTLFNNAPYFDGVLGYHDSHHLNEFGARLYGESLSGIVSQFALQHVH